MSLSLILCVWCHTAPAALCKSALFLHWRNDSRWRAKRVSEWMPSTFFCFFSSLSCPQGKCKVSVFGSHSLLTGGGGEQNRRNIKIHAHTHLTVPHACLPSANTHCEGRLNTSSAINQSRQIFYGMFSLFLVYSSEGLCACCVSDWTKKKKERADKLRNH